MIVPARVFLILMVPFLLHGALAGPPHAPSSGGAKNFNWLIEESPEGPEPASGQLVVATNLAHTPNVNVPVSPSPKSNLALETHSYETGDANQPSHDQLPPESTNHARIEYLDTLPNLACLLPKDTIYRTTHSKGFIYSTPVYRVHLDRIAITPQGIMIDIPAGSSVSQSAEPDKIVLPKSDKIKLHDKQTVCVLPVHTQYTTREAPDKFRRIKRPKKPRMPLMLRSDRIAYTTKGLLLLPAGSSIFSSDTPGYMDLPVGNTDIRIVSEGHRTEVEDFCNNVHENYVPPRGKLSERLATYMPRCRFINMWFGRTGFMEVPVRLVLKQGRLLVRPVQ